MSGTPAKGAAGAGGGKSVKAGQPIDAKATGAKEERHDVYSVSKEQAMAVERLLRDLHTMGHLDAGPVKVDERWDAGSYSALEEVVRTLGDQPYGPVFVDKNVVSELEKRRKELYFDVRIVNVLKSWDSSDPSNAPPYRLPNNSGEYYVNYAEELVVAIERPKGAPQREFRVQIVEPNGSLALDVVAKAGEGFTRVECGRLVDRLDEEERKALPIETRARLRCVAQDPYRSGRILSRDLPVSLLTLINVAPFEDDLGREHVFCTSAIDALRKVKEEVNALNGGKGKLILNSSFRMWPSQINLWKRYKRKTPGQDPANQPGTSWHETARAIDVDVWSLALEDPPGGARIKRTDVELAIVETEEVRKKGGHYLRQLDTLRERVVANGFSYAGERWRKYPWNAAFAETRRSGTIVSARYLRGLLYTFRFDLTGFTPNVAINQLITGGSVRLVFEDAPDVAPHLIQVDPKRVPLRRYPPGTKANKREHFSEIVWTVEAEHLTDPRMDFAWLKAHVAHATAAFEWSAKVGKAMREYRIDAIGVDVTRAPDFVTVEGRLDAGALDPIAAKALKGRVRVHDRAAPASFVELEAHAEAQPGTIPGSFTLELKAGTVKKKFPAFEPESAAGIPLSIVTRDESFDVALGRYAQPAYQKNMGVPSEKHHFQNKAGLEAPAKGQPEPEAWKVAKEWVKAVNPILDAYNQRLAAIVTAWKSGKAPTVKVPASVSEIPTLWKMGHYSEKDDVTRAMANIGNLPQPPLIEADLKALTAELESEALAVPA